MWYRPKEGSVNPQNDLVIKLYEYAYSGALGAFAALVGYLYQVARNPGNKVTLFMIFATTVIGFYLGILFGGFIPSSWGNRDAVLLLVGATGLKGFELVVGWAKTAIPNLLRTALNSGQPQGPPQDNTPKEGGQ